MYMRGICFFYLRVYTFVAIDYQYLFFSVNQSLLETKVEAYNVQQEV